jgi:hypothetical protein
VIGAFRQADQLAGLGGRQDEPPFRVVADRHEHREGEARPGDRHAADGAAESEGPGADRHPLDEVARADLEPFGHAGEAEGGVDDVSAGREREARRGHGRLGDEDHGFPDAPVLVDPPFEP